MIDLIIICTYFLIIILIGISKSSRTVVDISDFAVAQKSFPASILIFTFLATSFGAGSTVGDAAKIYGDGIIFLFGMSGFLIFCLIMIFFLAKYFDDRFTNMVSPGDIIKYFYGPKAEFTVGILGLFVSIFVVAGQIKGISAFVSHYSGLNQYYVTITAGLMVALYTAIGGVRAVTITDILQWIVIIITLPIIVFMVSQKAGGFFEIFKNLPNEKLLIARHPKFYEYIALFFAGCTPFLWMHPPLIQRYLMAKSPNAIKSMYWAEFIARPIIMILIMILAFSCLRILPAINSSELIPNLINEVLGVGFRGLIVAMILAAGMSTADSYLNASSVLVTKHVIAKYFNISKPKSQIMGLRFMTIALAIFAMLVAFSEIEIVHIVMYGFCFWGVGFSIPMVIGLLKMPTIPLIYWSSLTVGILSFFIAIYLLKLPGLAAPTIAILSAWLSSIFILMLYRKINLSRA
ncbi:MAG: sodium:solute symporter family protein [Candidatus Midichloria sp.]|nr:sodium:solute symporter family protein [Candidatus Midichloria sp.]